MHYWTDGHIREAEQVSASAWQPARRLPTTCPWHHAQHLLASPSGQVSHAGKPQHLCSLQVTSFCPDFFWRAETLVLRSTSRFWRTVKVSEWVGEMGMEREAMDWGDKRGTASGAGGIRVSDFPLKLFYKLCKRFSLRQTLEHTRDQTFPVEHSQLKAARIFPLQGHDQGASRWELSERVSFGSELPATPPGGSGSSIVNGGARWVCAGGPGWMLLASSTLTPSTCSHMLTPRPTRVPAPRLQCCDLRHELRRTWSSQSVWTARSRTTLGVWLYISHNLWSEMINLQGWWNIRKSSLFKSSSHTYLQYVQTLVNGDGRRVDAITNFLKVGFSSPCNS